MSRRFAWLTMIGAVSLLGCGDDEPTSPANRAPVMVAQRDTSSALGDTLELWAVATDPDGDSLTYGLIASLTFAEIRSGYRPAADMNNRSGYFWFAPTRADQPERSFKFTVHEGRGGVDSTAFAVSVR